MRFVRPVVTTVGSLTVVVRDIKRMQQVTMVLARHGLGILMSRRKTKSKGFQTTPQRIVSAIQELGPTFIKFGQILSTRPDILPPTHMKEFQKLQDDVSPLDFSAIQQVLHDEIGSEWRQYFDFIDEYALASASIAQVHSAVLKGGEKVVLKVQRPNIETQIKADLSILKFILERGLEEFPEFELFDPRGIFQEFEKSIIAELNFTKEAKNLKRFGQNFKEYKNVCWPKPYEKLSTERVLCMQFLDGISIRDARKKNRNMQLIGERYLTVAYSMLFEHGFFHGDLHPGNVLILENDIIGIIDCGMVGSLSEDMKDSLAALLHGLYKGDTKSVARTFFDIAIKEERVDYAAFERETMEVVEEHWSGSSFTEMNIGPFLMDITQRALRHHVRASPAFTMFFKGVMTTEGLAKSLLPEVDPLEAAQPYVEKLIRNRWHPQKWSELGISNIAAYAAIARRLPISISQFLDDIDHQRLNITVNLRQSKLDREVSGRHAKTKVMASIAILWMILGVIGLEFAEPEKYQVLSVTLIVMSLLLQGFIFLRLLKRE